METQARLADCDEQKCWVVKLAVGTSICEGAARTSRRPKATDRVGATAASIRAMLDGQSELAAAADRSGQMDEMLDAVAGLAEGWT